MSRKLRIVSVGRTHDKIFAAAINEYETRLLAKLRLSWHFIPHEAGGKDEKNQQIAAESNAIRRTLKDTEYVIVLDDTGTQCSTETLSEKLETLVMDKKDICIIIGGAYGVDDELLSKADFVWSLGKLTFPHQLVRLILTEQLYRAISIWDGSSYHHGN